MVDVMPVAPSCKGHAPNRPVDFPFKFVHIAPHQTVPGSDKDEIGLLPCVSSSLAKAWPLPYCLPVRSSEPPSRQPPPALLYPQYLPTQHQSNRSTRLLPS